MKKATKYQFVIAEVLRRLVSLRLTVNKLECCTL
jgi:hypothetical protein